MSLSLALAVDCVTSGCGACCWHHWLLWCVSLALAAAVDCVIGIVIGCGSLTLAVVCVIVIGVGCGSCRWCHWLLWIVWLVLLLAAVDHVVGVGIGCGLLALALAVDHCRWWLAVEHVVGIVGCCSAYCWCHWLLWIVSLALSLAVDRWC